MSLGKWMLAGGTLAMVGGIVWVAVVEPAKRRREAAHEIAQWTAGWDRLRDCVVTGAPPAQDLAESLLVLELTREEGRVRMEKCRAIAVELAPAHGDSSDIAAVETGWRTIGERLDALSLSLALYVADSPDRPLADLRADIAAKIAAVDEAHVALRKAGGLAAAAPPPVGAPPAPRLAEALVLAVDGAPLLPDGAELDAGVLLVSGRSGGGRELLFVRGANDVRVVHLDDEAGLRAAGDPAWAVRVTVGKGSAIEAVPVDSAGAAQGVATEVARLAVDPDLPDEPTAEPAFAMGAGAERSVLYWQDTPEAGAAQLVLATSHDGGKSFPGKRTVCDESAECQVHGSLVLARADVTWISEDGQLMWLPLAPGAKDGAPIALATPGEGSPFPRACRAATRIWWQTGAGVVRARHDGSELERQPHQTMSDLAACSDDLLMLAVPGPATREVWRCTPKQCEVVGRPPEAVMAIGAGAAGPLLVQQLEDYLLPWRMNEHGALSPGTGWRAGGNLVAVLSTVEGAYALSFDGETARLLALPK